jgi:hypothetical protein
MNETLGNIASILSVWGRWRSPVGVVEQRWWRRRRPACMHGRATAVEEEEACMCGRVAMAEEEDGSSGVDGSGGDRQSSREPAVGI